MAFLEACYRVNAKDLIDKVSKSVKTDLTQQVQFYNSLQGNKAEAMAFEKKIAESLLDTMGQMEKIYTPNNRDENDQKQLNTSR